MKKFKIAYVGAGFMGTEHAKAFGAISAFENVGVFSRTFGKAQDFANKFKTPVVAESIDELYQKTSADVVIVSVPELQTKDVCRQVFIHPWKILIEKPAGHNLAEAKQIYEMASAQNRDTFVAFNRRHYHSTKTLVRELEKSAGTRFIQILDQEDQIAARQMNQPEAIVQNWMFANSVHLIDYFCFLGRGEITGVDPIVKWNPEKPFHVVCKISYSSGDVGIYEAAWNRPGPWSATVTVPEARYELRPMEQIAVQPYGSRKLEPMPGHEWDTQFKAGLRAQAEEMLMFLQGQKHSLPTLKESLRVMELVQRIYC